DGYARLVSRFGPGKDEEFASLRAQFGEPDLRALTAEFGDPVRD
ncbi:phosphohydrolase, partial [Streptomyces sp. SID11233]|nr:phosphohydrolase [Streptomyces sp. SID11233]